MATAEEIKALRDATGVSIMQCKKALEEAGGDLEKAKIILRKASVASASKKSDRALGAGIAAAYTHAGGQVVAAVVLMCETDFVAKNEEFQRLAYEIAMHVAATNPEWRSRSDIKESELQNLRQVFEKEAQSAPAKVRAKVVEGKVDVYLSERVLLDQPYIKDSSLTVRSLIESAVQKFGEHIEVARFERLSVK